MRLSQTASPTMMTATPAPIATATVWIMLCCFGANAVGLRAMDMTVSVGCRTEDREALRESVCDGLESVLGKACGQPGPYNYEIHARNPVCDSSRRDR